MGVHLQHISIATLLSPVVGKSFKMKVQLPFVMAVMMGLAYSLDTCCQHPAGVKCVGDKCDLASQEELDSCTEDPFASSSSFHRHKIVSNALVVCSQSASTA